MSAYGRTKLQGEIYVKEFCRRYFILRTAWLYGMETILERQCSVCPETSDHVQVVNDQYVNTHICDGAGKGNCLPASHGKL